MPTLRSAVRLSSVGHQWVELLDQFVAQRIVMRQVCKRQRTIPGTHLRVMDRLRVLMRARYEVFCKVLTYLLWRITRRPIAKIVLLCVSSTQTAQQQTCSKYQLPTHSASLNFHFILLLVGNSPIILLRDVSIAILYSESMML
jgi:hypothetical protein